MELEIVSKKENPLLDRIELQVVAHHEGKPTPTREEVREHVAAAMKAKKDQVLVDHMESTFGKGLTHGYVKVYKSKEAAKAIEREPLLLRNQLETPKPKKKKKKEAAKPPEPAHEAEAGPEVEAVAKPEAPAEEGE